MNKNPKQQTVFLISDGTGITVESIANSVLSQFPDIDFVYQSYCFIDSLDKMNEVIKRINVNFELHEQKPIVFFTMVENTYLKLLHQTPAEIFDCLNPIIDHLETIFKHKALDESGRAHGFSSPKHYDKRIDAINFSLNCDDGLGPQYYNKADIILVGVSRCGKTPSCLYLALQYGIFAANYPITDDFLDANRLPSILEPFQKKIFGLTISAQRLHHIRSERKPHSQYASIEQCNHELNSVETLYKTKKIPYLDSTYYSIEEISARIISETGLKRRL